LEEKHENTAEQIYATFDQNSEAEMRNIIEAAVARKNAKEDSAF
jgi:hypothetical protein